MIDLWSMSFSSCDAWHSAFLKSICSAVAINTHATYFLNQSDCCFLFTVFLKRKKKSSCLAFWMLIVIIFW